MQTENGEAVSDPLPQLLDAKTLQAELGVTRAAAEAIMRRLPIVSIEGLRKTYVRRADVHRYLDKRTFAKSEVQRERRGGRKCRATHRPGGGSVVLVEQPLRRKSCLA